MTGKYHISALLGLIALIAVAACSRHSGEWQRLDAAERVMVAHPDSALAIIDSIDASALRGSRERARYALLRSMALDKNYVDTTTFDVLQPAIDYYLRHGTPTSACAPTTTKAASTKTATSTTPPWRHLPRLSILPKSAPTQWR